MTHGSEPEIGLPGRDASVNGWPEGSLPEAQRWETVGRLVGGVAHEFNNLLTAILIYSDLLAAEAGPPSRLRLLAREIRVAGGRGASLTGHLLALSRPRREAAVPVSLGALLDSMEPLLRHLAGEDVEVSLRRPAGRDRVELVPGQGQQVLLNLVANARDAMPAGGRLHIEVVRRQVRRAQPLPTGRRAPSPDPALSPRAYVVLRVCDTGAGIAPQARPRIFEPFFTTKGGRGTGLGLPAVRQIVQDSQGSIAVESAPGEGTTVSIYWPEAAEGAGRPQPRAAADHAPRGSGERVLLVEEDEGVRRSLRRSLRFLGYRVFTARDARSGLRLGRSRRAPLDLLLVCVRKRGLSAHDLAARLRARHPGMKVVYMCNPAESRAGGRAAAGERTVLRKPFPGALLARTLRRALGEGTAA